MAAIDRSDILDSSARLAALRRTALLDTPSEEAFNRLTRLASKILAAPISLVTLVDRDRQFLKSCIGLPEPWASQRQMPLSHSFCKHAVASGEPLIIEDARTHPLVHHNLAIPDLCVIAYAGIPLITSAGYALGSFCVIDRKPRVWTATEIEILQDLAASVMTEIELREATKAALQQEERVERERRQKLMLLESTGEGICGVNLQGECTFINKAAIEMLGYSQEEALGQNMHALIHHHHRDGTPYPAEQCPNLRAIRSGQGIHVDDDVLWRRDGTFFHAQYSSYPIKENGVTVGAVVSFSDISERKQAAEALQRAHDELERRVLERTAELMQANEGLRRLSTQLVMVQEIERRHLARELHDEVGQVLTALKMMLERAVRLPSDHIGSILAEAIGLSSDLIVRVQDLSLALQPPMLDDHGLLSALRWQLDRFSAQTGLRVTFENAGLERRFAREIETAAYRIVQEALTNVVRHAGVSEVRVEIWADEESLGVQVEDRGGGFDPRVELARAETSGLAGMRERVALLGGVFTLDSAPGAGTRLIAEFPLMRRQGLYERTQ